MDADGGGGSGSGSDEDNGNSEKNDQPFVKYMSQVLHACGGLATGYLLAHGSQAHPYILADNRHYIFYVWQRVLAYSNYRMILGNVYYMLFQYVGAWVVRRNSRTNSTKAKGASYGHGHHRYVSEYEYGVNGIGIGPIAVFGFLATAAATLVPTPLLEPRYFTPVVLVGLLHCPALVRSSSAGGASGAITSSSSSSGSGSSAAAGAEHDHDLAAPALIPVSSDSPSPETLHTAACTPLLQSSPACFAAVSTLAVLLCLNAVLLYVFLRRPFLWADGSVARFLF